MDPIAFPKENDAQLIVRLPKSLKHRVKKYARKTGRKGAMSQVARIALERGLAEMEKDLAA